MEPVIRFVAPARRLAAGVNRVDVLSFKPAGNRPHALLLRQMAVHSRRGHAARF
jgi:hypothetical protein